MYSKRPICQIIYRQPYPSFCRIEHVKRGLWMGHKDQYSHYIASLFQDFTYTIRDSIHKDIPLSHGFYLLSQTSVMQKLHRIKQLGPTYLTYPGSHHTRYEHSLGVFHLTRLIIIALLTKGEENPIKMTYKGILALLSAAMMHDVGHFPYAHALKDIIKPDHEAIGASLIEQDKEVISIIEEKIGTEVSFVTLILDHSRFCDDKEILLYRSLLSGTLDPDKLDYLSRDATYCGVPYGVQDTSYIIRHLHIDHLGNVAIPEVAIGAVEHLLFSKYLMYKYVYWHKRTRSATSMIKKSVLMALKEHLLSMEQLINLTDESFSTLMLSLINYDCGKLFQAVHSGNLLHVASSLPYDKNNTRHQQLAAESEREKIEVQIWEELVVHYPTLDPSFVIVDIPEEVSFEADVHISRNGLPSLQFHEVNELFTPFVVDSFTTSLRKFRLFVPSFVASHISDPIFKGFV
ncbi:MAG: HD domain-containing protein [Spirochaetia bacterium]|nr:HD domain-containing protein [Spirochaetia bacterium]